MSLRTTETWTVSLPPNLVREVKRVAKRENRTKSELVREALRRYIAALHSAGGKPATRRSFWRLVKPMLLTI